MPVSTRRRAQEGDIASEQDPEAALRKKPVRRTAAKTTKTEAPTKPTTSRARKDEVQSDAKRQAPVQQAKSIRKQPEKAKRDTVVQTRKVEAEEPEKPVKPTRSTRAGSVRVPKQSSTVIAQSTSLRPPEDNKPTTRRTRTAATKAPLSPKKVTQVSKVQTRNVVAVQKKGSLKSSTVKQPLSMRNTARRRAVSDENAEVPHTDDHVETEDDEEDEIMVVTNPRKDTASARVTRKGEKADSEVSMSSRPTTPCDSPPASADQESEDENQDQDEEGDDVESVGSTVHDDDSEDELNGPKTPMRRCSPGAAARYQASVRSTIKRINTTQRVPFSQKLAQHAKRHEDPSMRSQNKSLAEVPTEREQHDTGFSDDEPSFIPDEGIIDFSHHGSRVNTTHFNSQLPSPPASEGRDSDATTVVLDQDDEAEHQGWQTQPQEPSGRLESTIPVVHLDDEDPQKKAPESPDQFDSDDTVLITVSASRHGTDSPWQATGDDSVLIRDEDGLPQPETMIWDNIREDQTISVDFDAHLSNARTLPQIEDTERLSLSGSPLAQENISEALMCDAIEPTEPDTPAPISSRRQTVNFNDFVDAGALSDSLQSPTLSLQNTLHLTPRQPLEVSKDLELASLASPAMEDQATHSRYLLGSTSGGPMFLTQEEPETEQVVEVEIDVPHYALSTVAFDARRKSLPAFNVQTPVKLGVRPNTSDGASMPRLVNPFAAWPYSRRGSVVGTSHMTPTHSRPSTSSGIPGQFSATSSPVRRSMHKWLTSTPLGTPRERRPRYPPRDTYEEHAQTISGPTRFSTPTKSRSSRRVTVHRLVAVTTPVKSPIRAIRAVQTPATAVPSPAAVVATQERRPRLPPRETYEEHAQTVAAPKRFSTPIKSLSKRRETIHQIVCEEMEAESMSGPAEEVEIASPTTASIRTPQAKMLRGPHQGYGVHARTVTGPVRFQTPVKSPIRRSATVRKSDTLRKTAMKAYASRGSRTPVKTPLKAPSVTPSLAPMTPHPAAPLRGVVAIVEVFTLEGASASAPFVALLHRLGAKTTRSWSDRITHVVFKDGSPTTLQRVRLNNKEVDEQDTGNYIHCVNSRWVSDCDYDGSRKDEADEAYVVDVTEIPRGGKRRRKSMEPATFLNLNGSVIKERKSSLGASALSRSLLKHASAEKRASDMSITESPASLDGSFATPRAGIMDMEDGSPVTPAWIAAPDQLVQQTAPMNRIRKLQLNGNGESKNRRLTSWGGENA